VTPTSCEVCGGRLQTRYPRVVDQQTREVFAILACESCGLGHTVPRPLDLVPYYSNYYGGRHGWTDAYCIWRRVRWLREAAPTPGVLLDVGCGEGAFLRAAARRGWAVVGTELGEAARAARRTGLDVRESLEAARDRAPFTAVTMWHTLEHLPAPGQAVEFARKNLVPGGALIVAVPDAGGHQARLFGPRWFHLDVPRHLFHFNDSSLSRLLEANGLVVVRRLHQELEYDFFGWTQSALNSLWPQPNVLFHTLTGRRHPGGPAAGALHLALASMAGALALPAMAIGQLAGRGGTLIFVARKQGT
jgi:SAM-dependent methyltransferase